jgi:hypothetical protein
VFGRLPPATTNFIGPVAPGSSTRVKRRRTTVMLSIGNRGDAHPSGDSAALAGGVGHVTVVGSSAIIT